MKRGFSNYLAAATVVLGSVLGLAACGDTPHHHHAKTAHHQAQGHAAAATSQEEPKQAENFDCYTSIETMPNGKTTFGVYRKASDDERFMLQKARDLKEQGKLGIADLMYKDVFSECQPEAAYMVEWASVAIDAKGEHCAKARDRLANIMHTWNLGNVDHEDIRDTYAQALVACPPPKKTGTKKCDLACLQSNIDSCEKGNNVACQTLCYNGDLLKCKELCQQGKDEFCQIACTNGIESTCKK